LKCSRGRNIKRRLFRGFPQHRVGIATVSALQTAVTTAMTAFNTIPIVGIGFSMCIIKTIFFQIGMITIQNKVNKYSPKTVTLF
jgi:hypothetical protein